MLKLKNLFNSLGNDIRDGDKKIASRIWKCDFNA